METERKGFGLYVYILFGFITTIILFSYTNVYTNNKYYYLTLDNNSTKATTASLLILNKYKNDSSLLLNNPNCLIPDINVWDDEIKPLTNKLSYYECTKEVLLTYITTEDNVTKLKINKHAKIYKKNNVLCCAGGIKRKSEENVMYLDCTEFKEELIVESSVYVKCYNKNTRRNLYRNIHSVINRKEVEYKLKSSNFSENPLSVLMISIDSVSRLNSHRSLPKTRKFLEKNNWIELIGYNKVGENTFPNVMAFLTGIGESEIYSKCEPTVTGGLDKCPMIWKDYRDAGYITAYAEDQISVSTFNFHKKGFVNPPTDYYFRSDLKAAETFTKSTVKDGMLYCTGPEVTGERIMNIIRNFTSTFRDNPYFGLFWMNTFSHNELNAVSRMDNQVKQFLTDISKNKILDNTITIFFSDHGMRFGEIRHTRSGWYEDKLPFFFLRLPPWFKTTYPTYHESLIKNIKRLTTPFDLHQTLQHILSISVKNYSIKPSISCPKCTSLFYPVGEDRSCEDVDIPRRWCTCNLATSLDVNSQLAQDAGKCIVQVIEDWKSQKKGEAKNCAKFKLKKVLSALAFPNDNYIYVSVKTYPEAVFEATVTIEGNQTNLILNTHINNVLRIDFYGKEKCVKDLTVKKLCHCK